ncbi:hypothetical protein [Microvirga subterranea]|uniref:ClpP protease-like protein n=1 Tax=Microvirga subterranea TaxID=186651 RepID=A0A370HQE5_9HYPH|nr:hypothetical protein [Microvirga subterranea]RDI60161.1 hypothetical protein DES45_103422 [Microvirga subterranea]
MQSIGYLLGALLVIAAITQLFLWLLRQWDARIPRILVANALSLFLMTVLRAIGTADGGEPNFQKAFAALVIPQIVWLVIGLFREGRAARSAADGASIWAETSSAPAAGGQQTVDPENAAQVSDPGAPYPAARVSGIERGDAAVKSNNFIARHWRGEFPLWVSYWIFGFLANVAALVFAAGVSAALSSSQGYNPINVLGTLVLVWTGICLILVWQLVGIWRSANRHVERGRWRLWAGLAKLAVILGLLQVAVEFNQTGYPQIREATRMAFLDDPDIPAYAIRIMRNGTEVEVSGGFKYGLNEDFERILKAAPQVKVVHLNSDGGRLGEAEKLYRSIKDRNLITYTAARCASACTLAFAAGRERWIHPTGRLGFHAPTFPGMKAGEARNASSTQRALMVSSGMASDFVSRALSTPNESMWFPKHEELTAARVVTGVADVYKFAASGWGTTISREQMEQRFTEVNSLFATLKSVRPADFAKIVDEMNAGYLSGESEGRLIDAARARLLPVIGSYRPLADDQTVLDQGRLMVDQYKALASIDRQLCYEYASGVGATKNYASYLPADLRKRELEINERILKTASSRSPISEKATEPYWEAVINRLAGRFGVDNLQILAEKDLSPAHRAQYCDMAIAIYEEILNLKKDGAVMMLRHNFQNLAD